MLKKTQNIHDAQQIHQERKTTNLDQHKYLCNVIGISPFPWRNCL